MVREAGLEPARAYCTLEPESSESANSTTRAYPAPEHSRPVRDLSYHRDQGLSSQNSHFFAT